MTVTSSTVTWCADKWLLFAVWVEVGMVEAAEGADSTAEVVAVVVVDEAMGATGVLIPLLLPAM